MSNDYETIERLWRSRDEAALDTALAELAQRVRGDMRGSLALAHMLGRMERYGEALALAKAVAHDVSTAIEPYDLMIKLHLRLGDTDSAWADFRVARERGLPTGHVAALKALDAATVSNRFAEAKAILGSEVATTHPTNWQTFLQAADIHDRFAERWRRESAAAAPDMERIEAALKAQDPVYAAFLSHAASTGGEMDVASWEALPLNAMRSAGGLRLARLIEWRCLRAFPQSSMAKVWIASVLIRVGDMRWARRFLDEVLALPGEELTASSTAIAMRGLLSCAMFGTVSEQELLSVSARLLPALRLKEQALLAAGFAARSAAAKSNGIRQPQARKARPRIAVCLSGQLRSFRATWSCTAAALAHMDATVFVATWDNVGAGLGVHDTVARKLSGTLRDRLPPGLQTRTLFASRYPASYALLNEADHITQAECAAFFGTPHVAVMNEGSFTPERAELANLVRKGTLNQAKMYFGIHAVMDLKKQFEDDEGSRFDVVIRVRPDIAIQRLDPAEIEYCRSRQVVLTTYTPLGGMGDQFFMMNSGVADIVGSTWTAILAAQSFAAVPGSSGFGEEYVLGEQLAWHGVSGGRFRGTRATSLQSVTTPSAALWDVFRRDLRALDDLTGDDLAIASAISEDMGMAPINDLKALRRSLAD